MEGKEPKSTPFFLFWKKKQYKEIRLSDETKQPPTVPTRPWPILIKTENLSKKEPSLSCQTNDRMEIEEYPTSMEGIWMESRSVKRREL